MAVAGFCKVCGQYVYLNDQWGCVNGHAWDQLSNWYDPESGAKVMPYWLQPAAPQPAAPQPAPAVEPDPAPQPAPAPEPAPAPAAAPAPDDRLALLADVLATFSAYPGYTVAYGTDTDIVIDNQVADANWGVGKKKAEYAAIMKAVEPERTVYFWEILKEKGAGISLGGFEAETTGFTGTRWGKTKEVVVGPGGVAMDYTWDYAATRKIVEDVLARHGWKLKVVLQKKSAQW